MRGGHLTEAWKTDHVPKLCRNRSGHPEIVNQIAVTQTLADTLPGLLAIIN
jgi:hypothetical protein